MKKVFLIVLLANAIAGNTQNINKFNLENTTPVSPEVGALGKYFDIPIGYSSGTPSIDIPFHTVQQGALSVPISLSYNASGIRVEEAATWVGLGWNLNAGGSLSRVVKGLPDDLMNNGYMYTGTKLKDVMAIESSVTQHITILGLAENGWDSEPDQYLFSAMGYSMKFYYSQDSAKFLQTPLQNIKIEHSVEPDGTIKAFVITLPTGIKCYFGKSQNGLRSSWEVMGEQITSSISNNNISQALDNNQQTFISSWSLMELRSPANDVIEFFYTSETQTDFGRGGEVTNFKGYSGCESADNDRKASFYRQIMYKPFIERISSSDCIVDFIPSSTPRQDVFSGGKLLDSIIVKTRQLEKVKAFQLQFGYWVSPDSVSCLVWKPSPQWPVKGFI